MPAHYPSTTHSAPLRRGRGLSAATVRGAGSGGLARFHPEVRAGGYAQSRRAVQGQQSDDGPSHDRHDAAGPPPPAPCAQPRSVHTVPAFPSLRTDPSAMPCAADSSARGALQCRVHICTGTGRSPAHGRKRASPLQRHLRMRGVHAIRHSPFGATWALGYSRTANTQQCILCRAARWRAGQELTTDGVPSGLCAGVTRLHRCGAAAF